MKFQRREWMLGVAAAITSNAVLSPAFAQIKKAIKVIVPTSAGSSADTGARAIAEHIQAAIARPVVVENRTGAGGSMAADVIAAADPDGETIGLLGNSYLLFPIQYPNKNFKPMRDLIPVALVSRGANVLLVASSSPYKSLKDLLDAARSQPGKLAYASAGVGSSTFHSANRMITAAKIDVIHVPMRGSPEGLNEVIGGHMEFTFTPISVAGPMLKSGRVRALAVSTSKRTALLPDVPTTVEAGVPGSSYESWLVALVPAKTPLVQQERWNKSINAALESEQVRKSFTQHGVEPSPMSLKQTQAFVAEEYRVAMALESTEKR